MSYNPYSPPAVVSAEPREPRDVRLFGPAAIAAHAVLLTPLVGAIMAAMNRRRLGQRADLRRTFVAYVIPSAALIVLALIAPASAKGLFRLVTFGWSAAVARALYVQHKPIVRRHVEAGGRKARWYLATLGTFAALCVVVVVAVVVDWVAR